MLLPAWLAIDTRIRPFALAVMTPLTRSNTAFRILP